MAVKNVELEREEVKVYSWRMQWLQAGGWTKRNAGLIAGTDIDWRTANALLEKCVAKGYDQEFVLNLLI